MKKYVEYSEEECVARNKFLLDLVKLHPLKNRHWTLLPSLDYYLSGGHRYFGVGALSTVGEEHIGGSVTLKALFTPEGRKAEMENLLLSIEDYVRK